MNPQITLQEALSKLSAWKKGNDQAVQKEALDHYGKYFRPENLPNVTEEGFKDFLLIRNNRHWAGIHRQSSIYADMQRLRTTLGVLLDESRPIQERLDLMKDKQGPIYIRGLSRAVLTPILMCVYPDKYAVYNRISEEALTRLGMNMTRAADPFGKRYLAINEACHQISRDIGEPLYMVDTMFSLIVHDTESPLHDIAGPRSGVRPDDQSTDVVDATEAQAEPLSFLLEKHLEHFLVCNWEKTPLGKRLSLYEDDPDAAIQFRTDIGTIDVLARDKRNGDWVVVELKKGKHSDQVVGQVLRYMGWIKHHKATNGESVRGVIITGEVDDRVKYALLVSSGVTFYTYKVSFDLVEENTFSAGAQA